MIKPIQIKEPEMSPGQAKLKIFLYLAGLSVCGIIAAYVFEEEIYGLNYSNVSVIFLQVMPLFLAMFFLSCYRFPKLGLKLLGYGVEVPDRVEKIHTPTYDIFKSETPTDVKLASTKRKHARHLRKELARKARSASGKK